MLFPRKNNIWSAFLAEKQYCKCFFLSNNLDLEDLTLYAPEDEEESLYVANEDGVYVVNGEVKKIASKELPTYVKQLSNKKKSSEYNNCEFSPERHKKLNLKFGRMVTV